MKKNTTAIWPEPTARDTLLLMAALSQKGKPMHEILRTLHVTQMTWNATMHARMMPKGMAQHILDCKDCQHRMDRAQAEAKSRESVAPVITRAMIKRWSEVLDNAKTEDTPHIIADQVMDTPFLGQCDIFHVHGWTEETDDGKNIEHPGCAHCQQLIRTTRPDAVPCIGDLEIWEVVAEAQAGLAEDATFTDEQKKPEHIKRLSQIALHRLICQACDKKMAAYKKAQAEIGAPEGKA